MIVATDFDDRGVPRTLTAARTLSPAEIERVVLAVAADLEDITIEEVAGWPVGADGSIELFSDLTVDIYHEVLGHLKDLHNDLRSVPEEKWSSLAGLVSVIQGALEEAGDGPAHS
ncbi:hypothetical protein ACIRCZ_11450 [Leifsonia sp. NPDC102414]|uniref:hypothetical protein n=1 Tax=Leifsonia sp. NPDC102414 TaxID=3364124 RepID=UPI0037F359C9